MKRIQHQYIFKEEVNASKMIFLSGPRQVGKTTFVKNKLNELKIDNLYFNWDDPYVMKEYINNPHFLKKYLAEVKKKYPLVAFDEIHKHRQWKNILKGLYDIHSHEAQLIVTGSARLDFFRQSGDSLVGRYFAYRLLPLGLAEASEDFTHVMNHEKFFEEPDKNAFLSKLFDIKKNIFKSAFEKWLFFGGFPEPFIRGSTAFSNKWRRDYKSLLLREDLRDLTSIHNIKGIEQLMLILPERISSPLSLNSLREDLMVNHRTIQNWLYALKKIYLLFSIKPWSKKIIKAIKKEEKYYFFDWTLCHDSGALFENAVAVSLLRLISCWNELGLGEFELRYVRNNTGHEIDFIIIKDRVPLVLIEAKKSDTQISKSANYFQKYFSIPYIQIISDYDEAEAYPNHRYVVSAWRFLALLG